MVILAVIGFFVIGFALFIIAIYNALVTLHNNIKKSRSNIDVLLKQRSDELPKLIESVKGYMKHEKSTLIDLTKARTQFLKAKTTSQKAEADNMITDALKTIFAVAENYPKLRANENFVQLQNRISGIENELADRREFYNDSVNTYNIKIHTFPDMFFANMLGYKDEELFVASEHERKDVKVKF
ncbi:MAG: LemA family protein [Candidatus Aenigmarchaeota archaeon]|nr:LemA family protein [Candidatus Aenigmarchaeota archaeon]